MSGSSLLEGVRVIDFTRVLAGPYCTQILGDLGADVIKVEQPRGGDETRRMEPFYPGGESHYFLALNRNKRSLAVDLKSDAGRDFVLRLVSSADVVVENFRPGVMERLGLGFERLVAARPDIILCSISGFGHSGPLQHAPAFDLVTQARSGAMSVNGEPDGPPTKLGLPLGDLGGGFWATIAVLAALQHRHTDSGPQHLDVSLLDGLIAMQGYVNQLALLTGEAPGRVGSDHHNIAPYGRFRVKDGYLVLAILVDRFWVPLCHAIGATALLDDPRFVTNAERRRHHHELRDELEVRLRTRTRGEWEAVLAAADVPHGPVLDIVEALHQEQTVERGLLRDLTHPTAGQMQVVGPPIRVNSASVSQTLLPPPLLGEHTRQVATQVGGLEDRRVDELVGAGVLCEGSAACGDAAASERRGSHE